MEKTAMGERIHVTDANLDQGFKINLPVIVIFGRHADPAEWLPRSLTRRQQDGKLVVAKVNTDESSNGLQNIACRHPTMLFIADGKVMQTQVGALPEAMRSRSEQFLEKVAGELSVILPSESCLASKYAQFRQSQCAYIF
jgi:thioredoxin-like negative regulator of GroEL